MQKTVSKKALSFILITAFLNMVGLGIIIPVIPFLIQKYVDVHNMNAVALDAGFLVSAYALCQFLASPGLGILSDRFGRRPILLISLLGSAVGYAILGIGGALWVIFLGRIIDGLTGGTFSTMFAYIADMTEPQERSKYYGTIGAAMGFGFMVGPAIGGFTATINLAAPFYIAAIVTLGNVIWGYFNLPESLHEHHRIDAVALHHLNPFGSLTQVLKRPVTKQLILIGFFYFLAFGAFIGNQSVFLKDVFHWNAGNIGVLFFVVGGVDIIVQGFLIRKLLPMWGEKKLSIVGLVLVVISYLIIALEVPVPSLILPYLSSILFGIGGGLFEPSLTGLISHTAERSEQGLVQGANQSMQALSRVIGPLLAGWLYVMGWSLPYILCAVLVAIAFFGILRLTLPPLKEAVTS